MNKNCYRLIFSKVLASLIPVAEITTAQCKGRASNGRSRINADPTNRCLRLTPLAFALAALRQRPVTPLLAFFLLSPGLASANLAVDASAPANQQPGLEASANGTPVINIAAPNAGGLSHNKFMTFDVAQPGVIFNNSKQDGVSQIGGYVQHNSNLSGNEARAILSEVTGNSASHVNGSLEVFGSKADVLLANTSGVVLNGVNVINANNFTATTGRVDTRPDGSINFNVQPGSGRIEIGSQGFKTSGLSYVDIIARGIDLNGALGGVDGDIKLVAGLNQYDPTTRQHQKTGDNPVDTPSVAISGGLLGAMYGHNISLISTESGAGVRHEGVIHSVKDIQISADGNIHLAALTSDAGNISATSQQGDLEIASSDVSHRVTAFGSVRLEAKNKLFLAREVIGSRIELAAQDLLIQAAKVIAQGSPDASLSGVSIKVGRFVLNGSFALGDASGHPLGKDYSLVSAQGGLAVRLPDGSLIHENDWKNAYTLISDTTLSSKNGIQIEATELVQNNGSLLLETGGGTVSIITKELLNRGWLESAGSLEVVTGVLNNLCLDANANSGTLCLGMRSEGNVNLTVDQLNNQGLVSSTAGAIDLTLKQTGTSYNSGNLSASKNLTISQTQGQKAHLESSGQILSSEDLLIALEALSVLSDNLQGVDSNSLDGRKLNLAINSQLNLDGGASAKSTITVTAGDLLLGTKGGLDASGDISALVRGNMNSLTGSKYKAKGGVHLDVGGNVYLAGDITAERDLELVAGGSIAIHDSSINADNIDLSGTSIANEITKITSRNDVTIAARSGDLSFAGGSLVSFNDTKLSSTGALKNSGGSQLFALNQITLDAASVENSGIDTLVEATTVDIKATGAVRNTDKATIQANSGDVTVEAGDSLVNDDAQIAGANISLKAGMVLNRNKGVVHANDSLKVSATGDLVNAGQALMEAGQDIAIKAADVTNQNDASIQAGAHLTVDAKGALTNVHHGKMSAGQKVDLQISGAISNLDGSLVEAHDVDIAAGGKLTNIASAIAATQALNASAASLNNRDGAVIKADTIDLSVVGNSGNYNKGVLTAQTWLKLFSQGDVSNSDALITGPLVQIGARNISNRDGANVLGKKLLLNASQAFSNTTAGVVKADGGLPADSPLHADLAISAARIDNAAGAILSSDKLMTLEARDSDINNAATIRGVAIDAKAAQQFVNFGSIRASDYVHIGPKGEARLAFTNTRDGEIRAENDLSITTATYSNRGTLVSNKYATLSITHDGDLDINEDQGRLNPLANELLTINTHDLTITSDSTETRLENPGSIRVNAKGDVSNHGQSLISGKSIEVFAVGLIENLKDGLFWAMDNLRLEGQSIYNGEDGWIAAGRDMALKAADTITNYVGRISAGRDMTIEATTINNTGVKAGGGVHQGDNYINTTPIEYKHNHAARWTSVRLLAGNFSIPDGFTSDLMVKQAVLEAGGNVVITGNVVNTGSLIQAGNDMTITGDIDNRSLSEYKSVEDILKLPAYIHMEGLDKLAPGKSWRRTFNSLYEFLDWSLTNDSKNNIFGAYSFKNSEYTVNLLKMINSPFYNQLLSSVLGADWKGQGWSSLSARWNTFNEATGITFYGDKQAAIAVGGNFSQTDGYVKNGDGAVHEQKIVTIKVGDETVDSIAGDFDSQFNFSSIYNIDGDFDFNGLVNGFNPPSLIKDLIDQGKVFFKNFDPSNFPPLDLSENNSSVVKDSSSSGGAKPSVALPPHIVPLYETRMKFIDQSQFYGSAYFFEQVGYNTGTTIPVLGDAYFDHQLITRTVQEVTGAFFTTERHLSGEALVSTLMQNAGTEALRLGLDIGVPLTQEQWTNLEQDIVWYEPQTVDGVQVLVPKIYLSSKTVKEMAGGAAVGAKIGAGGTVSIDTNEGGVTNNNASITGKQGVEIKSKGDIQNIANGGSWGGIGSSDGDVSLQSDGSIKNIGGTLTGDNVSLDAGKDIELTTNMTYDELGNLVVRVGGEISSNKEGGEIALNAGEDVTLKGTYIGGGGTDVSIEAGGDLKLEDVHEAGSSYQHEATSKAFSRSEVTETTAGAVSVGSGIVADNLKIKIKGDMTITGGQISASDSDVDIEGNLTAIAGKNLSYSERVEDVEQFRIGGSASAGGKNFNASYGSEEGLQTEGGDNANGMAMSNKGGVNARWGYEKTHRKDTEQLTSYDNVQLDFGNGKVKIGETFDLGGADINANHTGTDLEIEAGDIADTQYTEELKKTHESSSIFFGQSVEAHSALINVSNEQGKLAQKAADGMSVDPGMTTAQVVGEATQLLLDDTIGVGGRLGVDVSKSSSSLKETHEKINNIGGNVKFKSTKGDIELTGVKNLDDKANIELDSAGDIRLGAAKDTLEQSSDSQSHSVSGNFGAACTAALGSCGGGFSVSYDGTSDKMSNKETHYDNSTLTGNITLKSKGDTTLKGANIEGQVNTDIGGDLKIESVQDTREMTHEQAGWGVSGGVSLSSSAGVIPNGGAHAEGGKDHDNYQLTEKQSGIQTTGDSNIKVGGDVDLKGGHIIDTDGKGQLEVGGDINTEKLKDTRDKDGGYGGGGGGMGIDGLPGGSVQFGRVDQIHQDIDQNATINMKIKGPDTAMAASDDGSGASSGPKINGDLNRDGNNLKQVNKDEHIAGNDVEVTINIPISKKPKPDPDPVPKKKETRDMSTQTDDDWGGDVPDGPTPGPKGDNEPRYLLSVTTKQMRSKIAEVNGTTDAQLKQNPVVMKVPLGDGTVKEFTIRSGKDLEQLNGLQTVRAGKNEFKNGTLPKGYGGSAKYQYRVEKTPSGGYNLKIDAIPNK